MKKIFLFISLSLIIVSCSNDDNYIRKDFDLIFDRTVSIDDGATFRFEIDSDLPTTIDLFEINQSNLSNDIEIISLNGNPFTSSVIQNSFEINLQPQADGYSNTTIVLDNGESKKFINFQFFVESGEITFAAVNYTFNTAEDMIVTNYQNSIFKFDFFTSRDIVVATDTNSGNYTVIANGPEISYSTSAGGTDVFRFQIQPL